SNEEEAKKFFQEELDDFFRVLVPGGLTKKSQEFATSVLKDRKLVQSNVKITAARTRNKAYEEFYKENGKYTYCADFEGLIAHLNFKYDPKDWRLSIDANLYSLKCVLLHNESKTSKPPLILVYAFGKRNKTEDHQAMTIIMELIQYQKHGWMIVSDLKVTNLCRGLKLGRPTYVCIYCLWPS